MQEVQAKEPLGQVLRVEEARQALEDHPLTEAQNGYLLVAVHRVRQGELLVVVVVVVGPALNDQIHVLPYLPGDRMAPEALGERSLVRRG